MKNAIVIPFCFIRHTKETKKSPSKSLLDEFSPNIRILTKYTFVKRIIMIITNETRPPINFRSIKFELTSSFFPNSWKKDIYIQFAAQLIHVKRIEEI